ncbi:hypothetical protein [Candidatus Berkiella aquae]|uniref:Uncharacterized protein n=1 Tax=Candidatus Berkiella aquae TaxID=295108 RepID=A0A0Q9YU69_9GAMM|nr:hypothetical protein [Candidatus Berkiella aquae]MCS5711067.1 hypothetical protein [Candidatus Berkiella aquae]
MPAKKGSNKVAAKERLLTLRKAKSSGSQSARQGNQRPSIEVLQNKYTQEQIEAYFQGYDRIAGTPEEQEQRKAKIAGALRANQGMPRPTIEELQNKYNQEQITIYLHAYNKTIGTAEEQARRKAIISGRQRARTGGSRPTHEILRKKYSEEHIAVYLKAYDEKAGTSEAVNLLKARETGRKSAQRRCIRPTIETLQYRNHYTLEQAQAYLIGFDKGCERQRQQSQLVSQIQVQVSEDVIATHDCPPLSYLELLEEAYLDDSQKCSESTLYSELFFVKNSVAANPLLCDEQILGFENETLIFSLVPSLSLCQRKYDPLNKEDIDNDFQEIKLGFPSL